MERASPASPSTVGAFSPTGVALAFALVVLVAAWPADPDLTSVAFVVAFVGTTTAALRGAYRAGATLTAVFIALNTLAYGLGLGDAVHAGVRRAGLVAPAESAQRAVLHLVVFLLVSAGVAVLVQRQRRPARALPASPPRPFHLGVAALLALATLSAFATGAWTHWGGRAPTQTSGGLRLELLYPALLFATFGLIALPTPGRHALRTAPRVIVTAILAILVFALQSRRLMFSSGILVAFATLRFPPEGLRRATARRLRPVLRVGLLTAALGVAVVASAGWRAAASEGEVELGAGLRSAVSAATHAGSFDADAVEGRLTYLWMDAIAVELGDTLGLDLDVPEALETAVLFALPSVIYRGKGGVTRVTCETPMSRAGVSVDLPCTPTAEAYLGLGLGGVALIALLWGLYLGIADRLTRRWTRLGRLAGLMLFAPATGIEVGLFPMVQGLRGMLIAVVLVAVASLIARVALERPRRSAEASRAPSLRSS